MFRATFYLTHLTVNEKLCYSYKNENERMVSNVSTYFCSFLFYFSAAAFFSFFQIYIAQSKIPYSYNKTIYYLYIYENVRLCKFNCYTEIFSIETYFTFTGSNGKITPTNTSALKIRLNDMKCVKGSMYFVHS